MFLISYITLSMLPAASLLCSCLVIYVAGLPGLYVFMCL